MQLHKITASQRGRINMTFICSVKIKRTSTVLQGSQPSCFITFPLCLTICHPNWLNWMRFLFHHCQLEADGANFQTNRGNISLRTIIVSGNVLKRFLKSLSIIASFFCIFAPTNHCPLDVILSSLVCYVIFDWMRCHCIFLIPSQRTVTFRWS